MRINAIKSGHAELLVDDGELTWLHNVLYFYEKYHAGEDSFSAPNAVFHQMAKQLEIAKCLSQYGRLDSHSLDQIIHHEVGSNPDGELVGKLRKLLDPSDHGADPELLMGA